MSKTRLPLLALALTATLALAGCETAEERAERFYQSGLALLEAGNEEQAMLEFRNVFKLNGTHKEARRTYADLLVKRGDVQGAMGQYLRLVEQYPDDTEVRWILAETSITLGNWDEVRRHGQAALEQAPDAPRSRVLALAVEYFNTKTTRPRAELEPVIARARALLDELGEPNDILLRLLIDYGIAGPDPQAALPYVTAAVEADPMAFDLQLTKFRLLAESNDMAASGDQLKRMFELFPDSQEVKTTLVGWYLLQRDFDGAEAFLRDLAGGPDGPVEPHVDLIQLVQTARGPEAAQAELQTLIEANQGTENAVLYASLSATIDFEQGRRDQAVEKMRATIQAAPAGDRRREAQSVLARMLDSTGNRDEARALVDAVLAEDGGQVNALKLRAAWLIEDDRPGEAVVALRTALDQSPNDPDTLTLMAAAHEREGNVELATERLALAVDASGAAPEESLRYARALQNQGRGSSAEAVLEEALRKNPGHVELTVRLAENYLRDGEWTRAQGLIEQLRQNPGPEAARAAQALQASALMGQNRVEESLTFLESGITADNPDDAASLRAIVMIVQTQIRSGRLDEARAYLDDALAERPQSPDLRLLSATLFALQGEMEKAEQGFVDLVAEYPNSEPPVRLLLGLYISTGRADEARALVDQGLAAIPESSSLRMMKAEMLERGGDYDGAIALYEALYAEDSNSVVLANNLASLLATHRDDAQSLERAFTISRRLRGVNVPAIQDTYGWIEYRRGNYDEALVFLESAARGLPEDPLVQYHLGMTYAALTRTGAARDQLTRALELAGDSALPQFATARETLAGLPAE